VTCRLRGESVSATGPEASGAGSESVTMIILKAFGAESIPQPRSVGDISTEYEIELNVRTLLPRL
jgi:hypothetical protein